MADVVNPAKRSQMMSGIRAKNSAPELLVRKSLRHKVEALNSAVNAQGQKSASSKSALSNPVTKN